MSIAALETALRPPLAGTCAAAGSPSSAVRPGEDPRLVLAQRGPGLFDPCASASAWLIREEMRSLAPARRRRALAAWHGRGGSPALVADEGCDVRIAGRPAGEAARTALLEWLPLAACEVAPFEAGLCRGQPGLALALLLRPPTIWRIAEARTLAGLEPPVGPRFDPARFAALERRAAARVGEEQLERTRRAGARIEAQLPFPGLPVASATVAAGCARVAADDGSCTEVAALQLARYAVSKRGRRATHTC